MHPLRGQRRKERRENLSLSLPSLMDKSTTVNVGKIRSSITDADLSEDRLVSLDTQKVQSFLVYVKFAWIVIGWS
jgi:hypothetical protein